MKNLKSIVVAAILTTLVTGCLNIIFSYHKTPKLSKDFVSYDIKLIDSFYHKYGQNVYSTDFEIKYGGYQCYWLFFDSNGVYWDALGGSKDILTIQETKKLYDILRKKREGFGTIYKEENKFMLEIAYGMRGLGFNMLYFEMEMLSNGYVKLILRNHKKFNKRAHQDPSIPELMNKELIFKPIKIK
jgi:hypothetical protein